MNSIQIEALDGYNREIEAMRQIEFDKFLSAKTRRSKRRAFRTFAGLTSQRSPEFITAYERALGIEVES